MAQNGPLATYSTLKPCAGSTSTMQTLRYWAGRRLLGRGNVLVQTLRSLLLGSLAASARVGVDLRAGEILPPRRRLCCRHGGCAPVAPPNGRRERIASNNWKATNKPASRHTTAPRTRDLRYLERNCEPTLDRGAVMLCDCAGLPHAQHEVDLLLLNSPKVLRVLRAL